jgi:hypothetical protein
MIRIGRPGMCAGLLGALGAAGRLGEIPQASDTWIAAPLREVLTQGPDAGVIAAGSRRARPTRSWRPAACSGGTGDDQR